MGNAAIIIILIAIVALAVYGTVRRIRYGSACCGEREPGEKKVRVKDKDRSNYPYAYTLKIDGMHCSNCAARVENALNKCGYRWAKADVGNRKVDLLSKQEEKESELSKLIAAAGYTMLSLAEKH
ncbi:MAG: cation transporter [Lachnospiraceae bacterium]|nr:cation transporter [Lachnospiraceae bacterium]